MSDRFIYHKNDIELHKTQCEFCIYNNEKKPDRCVKYPDGKPDCILKNIKKCDYLTTD